MIAARVISKGIFKTLRILSLLVVLSGCSRTTAEKEVILFDGSLWAVTAVNSALSVVRDGAGTSIEGEVFALENTGNITTVKGEFIGW